MNDISPIVLFVYRRIPKETINSLLNNKLAKESELFIFSDGYKNENDKQSVLDARRYINRIEGFDKLNIIERNKNRGLSDNIIDGVTSVIRKYGKAIVLEDDLIVSEDFLEYMNEALEFYEKNNTIWSISGYGPNIDYLKHYNEDVYLSVRGSSWGWATWENRWNSIDWDIKDWQNFKEDKVAIDKFNLGGNDMYKMLELQMLGKIDSWAIRWCYNQYKSNKYTIYPSKSKVINNGFCDAVGTHNRGKNDKWIVELNNQAINFECIDIQKEISECFQRYYNIGLITKIGYLLKKYGGYNLAKKIIAVIRI